MFPGWGGTARAPRIVGLSHAIEMITSGQSIDAQTALDMGWASDMVAVEQLEQAAEQLIRIEQSDGQFLRDRQQWNGPAEASPTQLEFLRTTVRERVARQSGDRSPAALAAFDLLLETANLDLQHACEREAEAAARQLGSPINRALVNVFFLKDRNKKDAGIDDPKVAPGDVSSIAVVGAGIMGAGIAAANLRCRMPVAMADACPDALRRGAREVMEQVLPDASVGPDRADRAVELAALLTTAGSDTELGRSDLVVEAVVEDAAIKRQLYKRLEPHLKPDAILASNTSTIPISELAERLQQPDRFCGMHFFNPVRRMKLVEIVRGRQTSDQTVATAVAYCKRIGKSPIVANDKPGFVVNRMLSPYLNASLELVIEGARIEDIDRAATQFGMNMGPIALYDMVGLDTAMHAGRVMLQAYPHRITATPIIPTLVKAGRLGQKSGLGFYSYQDRKRRPQSDPQFARLVEPFVRQPGRRYTKEELTARLFMPMLLEATCLLEDGIVRDPRDADLGLILGVGFPASKGGLLFWADTLGADKILQMLKPLEHLGSRGEPTPLLREMAKTGRKFY
jgi:3-hydroxyacyl-CoA dehydrogenase/enoyl-CoA hydratase/3-hydroxybutyryl-CoA epimerase/3-hydroxyacyl-CoA dehydrogenase/enoyl-CoA hydratase/3-hydroxybutyryl-CoA epimerase/enoyl-CoA isomerase